MTKEQAYIRIHGMLSELKPVEAIWVIETVGKEIRRKNSPIVYGVGIDSVIESERKQRLKQKPNEQSPH
jgi:hypothetical protein